MILKDCMKALLKGQGENIDGIAQTLQIQPLILKFILEQIDETLHRKDEWKVSSPSSKTCLGIKAIVLSADRFQS